MEGRHKTLGEITNEVNARLNTTLCKNTVRKYMAKAGFSNRAACKKPLLRKKNVKARLEWCKERRAWDEEWKKVVFSDESRFCLFHNDGREGVWRKVGERYNVDCLKPTVQGGGGSVMVWGCISWEGVGPLVLVEGTLNQYRYVNILSKHAVPYLKEINEQHPGAILQDDNATCHTAEYTTQWRQSHDIDRMPWPAQSPDLNPIEHLWDYLDRQVRKRRPLPTSPAGLAAALQDEWGKIPLDVVRNLISSMPSRVGAVIKAKGWHTSY